jgi:hypothetical protein
MPVHARPHLSTHTRGHGHSAVAGAAYRLGIRLVDRRTSIIHDYRRREAGDEIVRAITVAPPGAPDWAVDPDRLWNEVEAIEKRKDAQVARDFRVPIPHGLTDAQAGDLAEDLARFVANFLGTAVSMGLHRDNERDVVGEIKDDAKRGFHAHLYFPTRKIQCWNGEGPPVTELGWGPKLSDLASKRASGPIVELLNERWAEIANEHLREAGLTPDRDHRSYARLGIQKRREPKVGQAATAMERQGIFTEKGDAIRQIRLPSAVAEVLHAPLLEAQRRKAQSDRLREILPPPLPRDEVAEAQARGRSLGTDALLVERFAAALPAPAPTTRATFVKLLLVVRRLQRVLAVLAGLVPRLDVAREAQRRTTLAHWQAQRDVDDLTPRHAVAQEAVDTWVQAHAWRLRFRELMSAPRPKALVALERNAAQERRWLREAERASRRGQAQEEASLRRLRHLERLREKSGVRLEQALIGMDNLDPGAVGVLRQVATEAQLEWIDHALPHEPEEAVPAPEIAPTVDRTPEPARRRPRL